MASQVQRAANVREKVFQGAKARIEASLASGDYREDWVALADLFASLGGSVTPGEGPNRQMAILEAAATHPSEEVRMAATWGFPAVLDPMSAACRLLDTGTDPREFPDVRDQALASIGLIDADEEVQAMVITELAHMTHGRGRIAYGALGSLTAKGLPAAPALATIACDPARPPKLRQLAAESLFEVVQNSPGELPELVPDLIRTAQQLPREQAHSIGAPLLQAAAVLGGESVVVDLVTLATTDEHRFSAVQALGFTNSDRAASYLEQCVNRELLSTAPVLDEARDRSLHMLDALVRLGRPSSAPVFNDVANKDLKWLTGEHRRLASGGLAISGLASRRPLQSVAFRADLDEPTQVSVNHSMKLSEVLGLPVRSIQDVDPLELVEEASSGGVNSVDRDLLWKRVRYYLEGGGDLGGRALARLGRVARLSKDPDSRGRALEVLRDSLGGPSAHQAKQQLLDTVRTRSVDEGVRADAAKVLATTPLNEFDAETLVEVAEQPELPFVVLAEVGKALSSPQVELSPEDPEGGLGSLVDGATVDEEPVAIRQVRTRARPTIAQVNHDESLGARAAQAEPLGPSTAETDQKLGGVDF